MSSIAQEEARSISENCTWGQRKRFADGKVTVPFKRFLGYDRGENGELVVNEEQAVIVRRIYALFLQGKTPYGIAKILTAEGIPTPGGKTKWGSTVVESILTNEKYKGDALLQNKELVDLMARKGAVERFIAELRKQDAPVTEFSDNLWLNTVQSVRVETDGSMMFTFKDGTEVKV